MNFWKFNIIGTKKLWTTSVIEVWFTAISM